ncbi:hypothetical protein D3C78_1347100 [compost metagenome]
MGRVDVQTEAGETLDQLGGGGGQLILVLRSILAVDHQQRLFARIGVRTHAVAGLEAGRRGCQTTGIGRNRSIGIGTLFSADHSQAGAKLGSFLGGYGCLRLCAQSHGHGSGQHGFDEFHIVVLLLSS